LAEVLFELLKFGEDCNLDLEKAFINALREWEIKRPRWL